MLLIINKIGAIFLIMAVGFAANKLNILPIESKKYLIDLLLLITCPCMIVSSIVSKELTEDTFQTTLVTLGMAVLLYIFCATMGVLVCKFIFKVTPREETGIFIFLFGSMNTGFMGFPIALALFGKDVLFLMVLINLFGPFYFFTFGPMLMRIGSQAKGALIDKKVLLSSLKNLNSIAAVVGVFMLFAGLQFPQMLDECITTIGDATVPLSMIVVGVDLGQSKISRIIKDHTLVAVSLTRMLLMPGLVFLAVNWLPIDPLIKLALIFAVVFPAAVAPVPVVAKEGGNSVRAAEIVALTTALSVVTLPIGAMLLSGYYMS